MRLLHLANTLGILAVIVAVCSVPAFAQDAAPVDGPGNVVNLAGGPVNVALNLHLPLDTSSAAGANLTVQGDAAGVDPPGLAFYQANYASLAGKPISFRIVGTDPSLAASTTTIPTVIVPLKFVFPNTGNPALDGTNVTAAVLNSPIFQNADYKAGSVDLGVTQFGDALQRAEFWNLPGFSQNYHVLLGAPPIAKTITVVVPAGKGNAYPLSGGGFLGVLDTTYFGQVLAPLLSSYQANELPIFLTDNVFLGPSGLVQNCCIIGYHASQGPPAATAKTWIYAAYTESGTFGGDAIVDVQALSHEVAEWLNDPFVGAIAPGFLNMIPPAVLPGQGGSCLFNFETGDPLEALPAVFTKVTNSKTYHLQDEVVLPWYLHSTPSFSVNGWYTFQNVTATIPLIINPPSSIAGSYANTATLSFAPVNASVTGNVAYVGRGCPAGSISPGSAADPYLTDPSGKIVLIDRGACGVSLKIDRAVQAGAIGVLIGLVAPGNPISFSYAGGSNFAPSLVITQANSTLIKNALGSATVNATISPANAIPPSFSSLCGPG
jgi:hypothetical protein